jgi:hypothetical protein
MLYSLRLGEDSTRDSTRQAADTDKIGIGRLNVMVQAPLPVLLKECRICAKPRGYGISIFCNLVMYYAISYDIAPVRNIIPHEIPHEKSKKI